jgi:hypothetical protein
LHPRLLGTVAANLNGCEGHGKITLAGHADDLPTVCTHRLSIFAVPVPGDLCHSRISFAAGSILAIQGSALLLDLDKRTDDTK